MRPTDETRNQDLPRSPGDHSTLYVSLELSRSTWLVTSLSPNDKMSKHSIAAGDAPKLLALVARLRGRAEQFVGGTLNVVVIQEAGLDGFWVHRSLELHGGKRSDGGDAPALLDALLPGKGVRLGQCVPLSRTDRVSGSRSVNVPRAALGNGIG
jgi:hypothetical protein